MTRAVEVESLYGRVTLHLPADLVRTLRPGERMPTPLYLMRACREATRSPFRVAAGSPGDLTLRAGTADEIGAVALASDVTRAGTALIARKEAWAASMLSDAGLDPTTGLLASGSPYEARPAAPRVAAIAPWDACGMGREEYEAACAAAERRSPEGFSLPDDSKTRPLEGRRSSRPHVRPEDVADRCEALVRAAFSRDGPDADGRYMVRAEWEVETHPEDVAYVAVDAVLVPEQRAERTAGGRTAPRERRTNVSHWNAQVETEAGAYRITSADIDEAFHEVLALLLGEGLKSRYLVFLIDGQQCILDRIGRYFGGWPHRVILDWYHLQHKVGELFSLAVRRQRVPDPSGKVELYVKGKKKGQVKKREMVSLSTLYARVAQMMLWYGNWEMAAAYVEEIDPADVKSETERDGLASYIRRRGEHITCYAMRKSAGLRNSSNGVEGLNMAVVANRQKRDGMSWRGDGSASVASLSTLFANHEEREWFFSGSFRPRIRPRVGDEDG